MNFQIAAQGRSFKGAMAYYTHDKRAPGAEAGRHPSSAERVAWTETRNLACDRPEVATRVMIATAERADQLKAEAGIKATGRKAQKPVLAYSLAWHPDEAGKLDRAEMARAADDSLRVLGLEKHQAVIVAHRDTTHPHVHVIVNRVSPEDGRMATINPAKVRALDRWAHDYEQQRGRVVSPERAAKYERIAEKQRQYPDPEVRRVHVAEKQLKRAQAAQERRQAAGKALSLPEARKAVQHASERPQSPAAILRDISAATKERHRQDWTALRAGYAARKGEIYVTYKARMQEVVATHKRDTKPEWAAQFREERADARERQRMERSAIGRLSLSFAAAREQRQEQGGSFAKLVALNFVSRARRESAFAAASQRDRKVLSEQLGQRLSGRLEPLKADRARELSQALERFREDRSALISRQTGEWQKLREAWRQVGQEQRPEHVQFQGSSIARDQNERSGISKTSRFAWLDRQAGEPSTKPHQQPEQGQDVRPSPSRFAWLDRQQDPAAKRHDLSERHPIDKSHERDR